MSSESKSNRAGSHHLFTAGSGRARGRGTSRIALLLSLMLVAGALTVPAFAKPVEPGITSPSSGELFEAGEITLSAQASNGTKEVAWALWLGAPGGDESGVIDGDLDEPIDGEDEAFDHRSGVFEKTVTPGSEDSGLPSSNEYHFVFVENPDTSRETTYQVQFSVFENVSDCNDDGDDCSVEDDAATGQKISASADVNPKAGTRSGLGLGVAAPDSEGDRVSKIASTVEGACQDLLDHNQRLAGAVSHLLPVNFAGGDVTVEHLIPKSQIDDDTNKGTTSFQVCIAPDASEAEVYEDAGYSEDDLGDLGNTGLVGPILLDDCDSDEDTACVVSRERTSQDSGDLLITYRIPAVDPWMM